MKPKNRYIPYARQWIDRDDVSSVKSVLGSDFITQGPKIKEFEDSVADRCDAKYAVALSNGTAALHIACLAAGIKTGDEVITTPISFVASSNCVLYCRGRPVFADVQEDTLNINPIEVEKKITKRTKAIIPVHFAGHPCDLREIKEIANRHNLLIIEDAAHALGAEYRGTKIGSCRYSDMTIFSFHPAKHITCAEGGMVLTDSKDLYKKLIILRNHGITRQHSQLFKKNEGAWYYEMQMLGFNYRITDIQCVLGISQLKKLKKFIDKRRKIVNIYRQKLSKIRGLELPSERKYVRSSWSLFILRIKGDRKKIFNRLTQAGIGVNVHYRPIYLQPFYQKLGYKRGLCPEAEKYYRQALTISLYPKMTKRDVSYVIRKLKENLS